VRPDGCRDEPGPEAEDRDQPRWDAALSEPNGWDASDGARPDEAVGGARRLPALPADEGVGKLADREPGARARDASLLPADASLLPALPPGQPEEEPDAEAAPCTPDVVRFAERSCAELAVLAVLVLR